MTALAQTLRLGPPLAWRRSAIITAALVPVFAVLMLIDDRQLLDVSVWLKPLKFHLSIAVYFATLVVFARLLPTEFFLKPRARIMIWAAVLATAFELIYISLQAGLGEASHFNGSTSLHATMYSLMGIGAVTLVAVVAWIGIEIAVYRGLGSPYVLSVLLGALLTFGLGGGFGGVLGSNGGHWVGACQSDADGMFFTGWSTRCGDLRVAHFFGMHAMQIIPLLGFFAQRWLSRRPAMALVLVGSVAYSLLSAATFVQALNGKALALLSPFHSLGLLAVAG